MPASTPPTPRPPASRRRRRRPGASSRPSRRSRRGGSRPHPSSPRVGAGGTAGGFALASSSFGCARAYGVGCARGGLDVRERRPGRGGSERVRARRQRALLSDAVVHPLLPQDRRWGPAAGAATHDAGMDARYAANLGSSSSAHGGVHEEHVRRAAPEILGRDDDDAPALAEEPRPRLEPELVDGARGVERDDPRSKLVARHGPTGRPWKRPRRGVVTRTMARALMLAPGAQISRRGPVNGPRREELPHFCITLSLQNCTKKSTWEFRRC